MINWTARSTPTPKKVIGTFRDYLTNETSEENDLLARGAAIGEVYTIAELGSVCNSVHSHSVTSGCMRVARYIAALNERLSVSRSLSHTVNRTPPLSHESQTRNSNMKLYCIIAPQDVTQYRYRTPTQRRNILKRVYEVVCRDGVSVIYQVENQRQLATRLGSAS